MFMLLLVTPNRGVSSSGGMNPKPGVAAGLFSLSLIHIFGRHIGKLLEKQFGTLDALLKAVDDGFDFASLEGMGPKKAANLVAWLKDPESRQEVLDVAKEVRFKVAPKATAATNNPFKMRIRDSCAAIGTARRREALHMGDLGGFHPDVGNLDCQQRRFWTCPSRARATVHFHLSEIHSG